MVYHYTTIDSFYSIMANYKASEDKDHFVFWASSILDQNDTEEMHLCFDDIRCILEDFETANNITNPFKRLSQVHQMGWLNSEKPNEVKEKIYNMVRSVKEAPFTISFSKCWDKLLMWSMYGKNGTGICLSFDEQELKCNNDGTFPIYDTVVYDKNRQNYEGIIKEYYRTLQEKSGNIVYLNGFQTQNINSILGILLAISPFIKNPSFKEEEEWRMAFYTNTTDNPPKVYTRITSNQNVIHYIKIKIPVRALKRITTGPTVNYKKTRKMIIEELQECGIDQVLNPHFITKSKVPYRIY